MRVHESPIADEKCQSVTVVSLALQYRWFNPACGFQTLYLFRNERVLSVALVGMGTGATDENPCPPSNYLHSPLYVMGSRTPKPQAGACSLAKPTKLSLAADNTIRGHKIVLQGCACHNRIFINKCNEGGREQLLKLAMLYYPSSPR